MQILKREIQVIYFKRLGWITLKVLFEIRKVVLCVSFTFFIRKDYPHPHTHTHLFNMTFILFPPCYFSCIPSLLNSSTCTHRPHQKPRSHPGLPPHPQQLHLLLAQPSAWPAPLPWSPEAGQLNPPAKAKAWLTFGVQEVKCSSNIPHHSAGISLIEVLPLLDVGQDGAWGAEGTQRNAFQALLC